MSLKALLGKVADTVVQEVERRLLEQGKQPAPAEGRPQAVDLVRKFLGDQLSPDIVERLPRGELFITGDRMLEALRSKAGEASAVKAVDCTPDGIAITFGKESLGGWAKVDVTVQAAVESLVINSDRQEMVVRISGIKLAGGNLVGHVAAFAGRLGLLAMGTAYGAKLMTGLSSQHVKVTFDPADGNRLLVDLSHLPQVEMLKTLRVPILDRTLLECITVTGCSHVAGGVNLRGAVNAFPTSAAK